MGSPVHFETLNGENVAVIQSMEAGYRLTRWLAPKLGCEALRYEVERRLADGSFVLQTRGVSTITEGEPDAGLFGLAADYTELKPSEVQRKVMAQIGAAETPEDKKRARALDGRYYFGR